MEKYHREIFNAGPLLEELRKRGISDETLRLFRIGFFDGRITIPIFDAGKNCIQVRRYLPGAPGPEKMRNTRGFTSISLYPVDQLKFDTLWLCGGEIKALAAAQRLNAHKIGAFCVTAGEGTWDHQFTSLIRGKTIVICMDIDAKGRKAAAGLAQKLSKFCSVQIVNLPLDPIKFPKGDLNDFVAEGGDLLSLPREEYEPEPETSTHEIRDVSLQDAYQASNVGLDLRFSAEVNAIDTTPILIPKRVRAACDKEQRNCAVCPLSSMDFNEQGFIELTMPVLSQATFQLATSNRQRLDDDIKACLGVPTCRSVHFTIDEYQSAWETRLGPKLSLDIEHQSASSFPALCLVPTIELNAPYQMEGRVYPHPKNLQAYFLIREAQEEEDSLNSYSPDTAGLTHFQPKEWTLASLEERLDEIYSDLEANVTRIYGRRDLHLAIDLVYHSPILLDFDGRLTPGWTNILILGDSAQGKSESTTRLRQFYGLGESIECKNASVAGLLGGLQQMGSRWFVTWGIIPQHDRRLVVLEEVKGAPVEVLARLTDMRSRGIAEIPKIERRRSMARTRLIWISNPRSNRPLSGYNFGVDAILELIGGLEDIRRFDLALILSSKHSVNLKAPKVRRVLDGDDCKRLILWNWTRRPHEIKFDGRALTAIEDAQSLCDRYSDSIPLVDRGTFRQKLARLSAGLAGRTFSHDGDSLIVRECHVQFVVKMLQRIYDDPLHGYGDFSRAERSMRGELDSEAVAAKIQNTKHPQSFVRGLLGTDRISLMDIQDWCEVERDTAQRILSALVRARALTRDRTEYLKTPLFIDFLKKPITLETHEEF